MEEINTTEQTDNAPNSVLDNLERAKLFALYGGLGQTACKLTEAYVDESGSFDHEAIEASEGYRSLVNTLEILDKNRATQEELGLTQKNDWNAGKGFVKEMFEKGNKAIEISVRVDEDGHFVLAHWSNEGGLLKGRRIDQMTTEEVSEKKDTLDDALEVLRQYKAEGNKMIIQIKKPLGKDPVASVAEFVSKLEEYDVEDCVAIASLQPSILAKVHQIKPNIPMIVNRNPVFAEKTVNPNPFDEAEVTRINELTRSKDESAEDEWMSLGEIKTAVVDNEDSSETVLMQVPEKTIRDFCQETGAKIGVSNVFIKATILKALGFEEKANNMIKTVVEDAHDNGMRVQISTWGSKSLRQALGKFAPGVDKMLEASEQVKMAREAGIVPTDVIYDHDAVGTAEKLQ